MGRFASIFRQWKHQCKTLYETYGPEGMPVEFNHRPEQWQWLIQHFEDPKQKELCKKMQAVQVNSQRIVHRSGKLAFVHRAERHYEKGSKAPVIDALDEVYGADPRGAELVAEMKTYLEEVLGEYAEDGQPLDEPLPVDTQMEIIDKVVAKRKGTAISGVGNSFKRQSRPRSLSRPDMEAYIDLQEQLKKKDEEHAKKEAELEDRLRALEARFGINPGGNTSPTSDGASFRNNSPPGQ